MMWSVEESRALAVAVDNLPYAQVPAAIEAIHVEGAKAVPSLWALPENVLAVLPVLVAAGGFHEGQRRVPKGNPSGGEWVETAGGILESLGVDYGDGHGPGADRMAAQLGAPGEPVALSKMRSDPYTWRGKINPAIGTVDHAKAMTNCQRVVFAAELQARGFAASAPPSKGGARLTQVERNFKGTRQFSEPVSGMKQLGALVKDDPPGSRYILSGMNGRAAHVWNAEMGPRGGLIVFDAQSGAVTSPRSMVNWSRIMRVDDLEIKDDVFTKAPMDDSAWVIPEAETP